MRLVNFGPGEMADRLTILSLKITYGKQASRPVEHFQNERNALLVKMPNQIAGTSWFEGLLELGAVNAMIWQDTDRVRYLRLLDHQGPIEIDELAHLAIRLQTMNDRRAILITFINVNTGNAEQGDEKS